MLLLLLLLLLKKRQWDVCTGRRCSAKESVFGSLPNFYCPESVTLPLRPPRYINFFEPFHFLASDQLVVPIGHRTFLYSYKKYNQGSGRKENKRTICLGLTQSARRGVMQHSAFLVCICRLTLAWISSETSTKLLRMPTYPDRSSSLLWTSSHPTGLSAVWCRLPCPSSVTNSFFESLFPTPFSRSPTHFRSRRDLESKTLCLVSRQNRQRNRLLGGPPT